MQQLPASYIAKKFKSVNAIIPMVTAILYGRYVHLRTNVYNTSIYI